MRDKRDWKIFYSDYSGMEKKAVELISKEMGRMIIRDKGVFVIYVLACEKLGPEIKSNAVVVGLYDENELIRKYIDRSEIPENGYVVRVMDNPKLGGAKLALITACDKQSLFYGAVNFVDDYFAVAAPKHGGLRLVEEIFESEELPDYYFASAPKFKTRSIFTWGQPINDYRSYIENMARMKLNQIIVWNDYIPLNADEFVEYAHEYGIEVIWGYSWGWRKRCAEPSYLENTINNLETLKERVLKEYKEKYSKIKGDGIYFQSFTELYEDFVGEKIVAEVVTDFVNKTAGELLRFEPDLHIQFGLHAISVKDHMYYLENVDKRIEILWEDCGSFPYNYTPEIDEEDFETTLEFTNKIIHLRGKAPLGLVYKGQMTMDWNRFQNQSGPYILGMDSPEIVEHDKNMMKPIWRVFQAEWTRYGEYAYRMTNRVLEETNGDVNLCIAATLSGGIWYPTAICAELFWDPTCSYEVLAERVGKRHSLSMA